MADASARRGAALAVAVALAACGGRERVALAPAAVEDLLTRRADVVVADIAPMTPTTDAGWGQLTGGGWLHRAEAVDGELAVATNLSPATLLLPAGVPRDRTVELRARLEVAEDSGSVQVVLNGIELGAAEVGATFADVSFVAPAAAWLRGTNELALSSTGPGGGAPTLQLARVGYTPTGTSAREPLTAPMPLDGPPTSFQLAPSEARVFALGGAGGGRLDLVGRPTATDDGALHVVVRDLDSRTGATAGPSIDVLVDGVDLADGMQFAVPAALGPLAELELEWLADGDVALDVTALSLARPPAPAGRAAPHRPPLIVFLSVDTLSAPHMSLYGYERATTPRLEQLAGEAVVFDHCTANSTWTVPSYLAQFTGLLANSHTTGIETAGAKRPSPWDQFQLAEARLTLAELLRAAGYRTVGIVDNHWLTQIRGVRQGFDRFDTEPASIPITMAYGGMRMVFDRARAELKAWDGERPLFLFLQVLDVHGPYVTSPPWSREFDSGDPGPMAPVVSNWIQANGTVHRYLVEPSYIGRELPDAVPVHPLHDDYDAKVLELDHFVGELVDDLRSSGHLDEALFVLSADHGESTLHRDFYFRHKSVYEPTTHVPLIVRLPGGAGGGRRVPTGVQLVDLYPTLAELVGVDAERLDLHGRSFAAALSGDELEPRPAIVEVDYLGQRAVVHDGWKLVATNPWEARSTAEVLLLPRLWRAWADAHPELAREFAGSEDIGSPPPYDGARIKAFERKHPRFRRGLGEFFHALGPSVELFDLRTDPGEQRDLSTEEPERVQAMLAALEIAAGMSFDARNEVETRTIASDLSAASRRQLIELGYLEDDEDGDDDGPDGSSDGSR